jgi:hypothetical protein
MDMGGGVGACRVAVALELVIAHGTGPPSLNVPSPANEGVLVCSLEMATLPDGPRPRRYDRSSACHRCGRQLVAQTPKLLRTVYRAHLRKCRHVR